MSERLRVFAKFIGLTAVVWVLGEVARAIVDGTDITFGVQGSATYIASGLILTCIWESYPYNQNDPDQ